MKEEKKCIYCLEDIDYKKHGLTKYCSVQCRNKDYYKKNKSKTENYPENATTNEDQIENEIQKPVENRSYQNDYRRIGNEIISGNERGEIRTANSYSSELSGRGNDLVRYYDAKVEATRYELKCEYLESRVKELEQEIIQLESELEECNSEENDDQNNIIGGLVSSFKNDPLTTIEFGSAMIQKLFSSKETKAHPNQP